MLCSIYSSSRHVTVIFWHCHFKNWYRTKHVRCFAGAIFTAGTARLSVYTCVKASTALLIGVLRRTYLIVLGAVTENLETGAEPARTVYSVRIFRLVPNESAPVPKY